MLFLAPLIFVLLFWLSTIPVPQPVQGENFEAISAEYIEKVPSLDIPGNALSWKTNLTNEIENAERHDEQKAYFTHLLDRMENIESGQLGLCQRLEYDLIKYETRLNLERIGTFDQIAEIESPFDELHGIHALPNGPEYYHWYLRKWLTSDIGPDEIAAFGEAEIANGLAELTALEDDIIGSGVATSLQTFINGDGQSYGLEADVLSAFDRRRDQVEAALGSNFKSYDIAAISIKPNTNPAMARAPGYYRNSTFFFTWDGASYPKKEIDYLYMHEAVPGHHFQTQIAMRYRACSTTLPVQFYSAYAEGWAAYIETLGAELSAYNDFATRQGAIDWNLIRSIRVYLDVAINYHGWSVEQATAYWTETMPPHLHGLAAREIKRMQDWPAQVITYKVGAKAILDLREKERARLGDQFDIRTFHDRILRMGPVPLDILEQTYLNMP
jgi:uncharacterized protein (DUF885 family)